LSLRIHLDKRHASGSLWVNENMGCIDTFAFQCNSHFLSKSIVAYAANHSDIRTQTRSGNGLVRTFSTWECFENASQACLPWFWDLKHPYHQVHIETSNHNDIHITASLFEVLTDV
jgi:hypothetical protein